MTKRKNSYADFVTQTTPQAKQAHPKQVPNSAGGWSFKVDHWTQMQRFLILGSADGTYYIQPKELTLANMEAVKTCLREDGLRAVQLIASVSWEGRAAKNSPAIFALALAALPQYADPDTNRAARGAVSIVCRTATMLYEFCEIIQKIGKWNRGLRTAVANWFLEMDTNKLAYQLVKYRQRDGWTARDVLRLCHVNSVGKPQQQAILRWAVTGKDGLGRRTVTRNADNMITYGDVTEHLPAIIQAFETVQTLDIAKSKGNDTVVTRLIREQKLPREALPTAWLNDRGVWAALLETMPVHAMVRNLATMTRVGLLETAWSDLVAVQMVIDKLTDPEEIKRSRLHPVAILAAAKTYAQGKGIRGSNTWKPNQRIVAALNDAFRLAFVNVKPYQGRVQIAVDVSGSMNNTTVIGLEYVSAIEGAAALALPMLNAMPNAFTTAFNTGHVDMGLGAHMSLSEASNVINRTINGGTNCAAPIEWAEAGKRVVDLFVILTDSESWAGGQHPFQALQRYRQNVNPNARLAVVAMCANEFSLGSPEDGGSIDLIGFDINTPLILEGFAQGDI